MATILLIAQIIGLLISIPSWIIKFKELIDLIRRLPKAEQIGALRELRGHARAVKAAEKMGGKANPVAYGTVFESLGRFEVALNSRLKDNL